MSKRLHQIITNAAVPASLGSSRLQATTTSVHGSTSERFTVAPTVDQRSSNKIRRTARHFIPFSFPEFLAS